MTPMAGHVGWLIYQFVIHQAFEHLFCVLWVKDHYRASCTGFHRLVHNAAHPLRIMHLTCNIREVADGTSYPGGP